MEAKKVYYFIKNGNQMDLTLSKQIAEQHKEYGLATIEDLELMSCVGLWFTELIQVVEGYFKWFEDEEAEICEYISIA